MRRCLVRIASELPSRSQGRLRFEKHKDQSQTRKKKWGEGVESVSREREAAVVRSSGGRVLSSAAFARPPYAVLSHISDCLLSWRRGRG